MSSGSYQTKAGFREDLKPAGPAACASAQDEERGPGLLLAGLCVICGRTTIHRNAEGFPQHLILSVLP